jgi:glucuronoarabinoxylan endo-1,4-beta-xylanase
MSGITKLSLLPKLLVLVFTLALFIGCRKESDSPEPLPVTVAINKDSTYQTIAGFGGANRMWGTQFLKPAEAKKAFGTDETDLGLSIYRKRHISALNYFSLN